MVLLPRANSAATRNPHTTVPRALCPPSQLHPPTRRRCALIHRVDEPQRDLPLPELVQDRGGHRVCGGHAIVRHHLPGALHGPPLRQRAARYGWWRQATFALRARCSFLRQLAAVRCAAFVRDGVQCDAVRCGACSWRRILVRRVRIPRGLAASLCAPLAGPSAQQLAAGVRHRGRQLPLPELRAACRGTAVRLSGCHAVRPQRVSCSI